MVDKQGLQDQTQALAPYLHPHSARTMVSSMIDDYNALIASENNGKKRKISEVSTSENNLSKTLKEQVFILTKIQDNLLNFLRQKLDVSDEEISKIREIGNVTLAPVKRNPREIPGIFMDDEKRKYYINVQGAFVYKRPCGKPRKEKMWCHALGEWVESGTEVSEEIANKMEPDCEEPDVEQYVPQEDHPEVGRVPANNEMTDVQEDTYDNSSLDSSDNED